MTGSGRRYLAAMRGEMDYPELFPDYVAGHRAHIIEGATSASVRSRVFQKYLWLARYLDYVSRGALGATPVGWHSRCAIARCPRSSAEHKGSSGANVSAARAYGVGLIQQATNSAASFTPIKLLSAGPAY
jgi:hypothetical protein